MSKAELRQHKIKIDRDRYTFEGSHGRESVHYRHVLKCSCGWRHATDGLAEGEVTAAVTNHKLDIILRLSRVTLEVERGR